jgi:hypothetical protein
MLSAAIWQVSVIRQEQASHSERRTGMIGLATGAMVLAIKLAMIFVLADLRGSRRAKQAA